MNMSQAIITKEFKDRRPSRRKNSDKIPENVPIYSIVQDYKTKPKSPKKVHDPIGPNDFRLSMKLEALNKVKKGIRGFVGPTRSQFEQIKQPSPTTHSKGQKEKKIRGKIMSQSSLDSTTSIQPLRRENPYKDFDLHLLQTFGFPYKNRT